MTTQPPIAPLYVFDETWLAAQQEAILEPERPIIDPHHHLWDHTGRYLFDELLADVQTGHNIRATVFIQCRSMYRADGPEEMRCIGEVEFVNGAAARSASGLYGPSRLCAGIVGHADLTLAARVAPVLDALLAAGNGRLRGIRNSAVWHEDASIRTTPQTPPRGLLLDTKFRDGVRELGQRDLSFDSWMYFTQVHELADLADAFPHTRFVLDHCGGVLGIGVHTGRREADFPYWKAAIADLAKRQNVCVKLGGLAMRSAGFGLHDIPTPLSSSQMAALWKPYVETCIEAFGANRCMFESNFPVDKSGTGYAALWNAFKLIAADYSANEKHALFFETANSVYRLDIEAVS
ncbi:amidohydrolase family protein [Roseiarcaceae bacterium H3SJ34-1]|uniref:amidohydrolase family protein n=1 Tax=Terripilifer ovatus TaxID=3032367 RepID=UPI003AB9A5B5|nr:amidohydrolase family protein [Roseiarcaceae bacterium H3SJ34-1]